MNTALAHLSNRADMKAERQFAEGFYGKQYVRDENRRRRRKLVATIQPWVMMVAAVITAMMMLIQTVTHH